MKPEYHNQVETVRVGEKYESVTIKEGTISLGDILVYEDVDAGYYDESVSTSLYVAPIKSIYRLTGTSNGYEPQLEFGITAGVGRVDMSQIRAISGKEIYYYQDGHKCDMKFIDRFLSSDYKTHMNIQWTRDGDHIVSGV